MALLVPTLTQAGLHLAAEGIGAVEAAPAGPRIDVRIWDDTVPAATCGRDADEFLSAALGTACHLVYLDDPWCRPVAARWRQGRETVAFADGFPVLLTSMASLDDLNRRLAAPVRISRFRGNVVVAGGAAWEEDTWRLVRIGAVTFRVAKPCARCLVTTIEQETARRPDKREPLRTLATFRRAGSGVMFGQNLVPLSEGAIAAGDPVTVLETGASNLS
jgi:uncharacterized protein YcbX